MFKIFVSFYAGVFVGILLVALLTASDDDDPF